MYLADGSGRRRTRRPDSRDPVKGLDDVPPPSAAVRVESGITVTVLRRRRASARPVLSSVDQRLVLVGFEDPLRRSSGIYPEAAQAKGVPSDRNGSTRYSSRTPGRGAETRNKQIHRRSATAPATDVKRQMTAYGVPHQTHGRKPKPFPSISLWNV